MVELFAASSRAVIIYASDVDIPETASHVRRRPFTPWIAKNINNWKLTAIVNNKYPFDPTNLDNTSYSNFYIFSRINDQ